jgi:hypothetical protein
MAWGARGGRIALSLVLAFDLRLAAPIELALLPSYSYPKGSSHNVHLFSYGLVS